MWPLLKYELKYYFKNKQEAIYLYSYFVSILVLIPFAGSAEIGKLQALAPLALWIGLASAIALGANQLYRRDHTQGRLEYYQLLPIPLEAVILIKWMSFVVFLLVPLAGALPLAALLFHIPGAQLAHYAIGLGAGAIALSMISALVAAITSGLQKAGAILSLVILPLAIPVLIAGSSYCQQTTGIWQPQLLFMLGLSLFLLPIMCLGGAHSIRSGN